MNDIIKVNYSNDRQTISARDLWEFLDKPYTKFTMWFDKYKSYGFTEGEDYRELSAKTYTSVGAAHDAIDYEITIDMAKEFCMLQRTEKGKIARQYFINLEKKWNSPEVIMKRALQFADERIKQLENRMELDKPKVDFADHVATSTNSLLVREVAKIISKDGIEIGEKRLYKKLRTWGWVFQKSCEATQDAIKKGYMEISETVKQFKDGQKIVFKTSRVTGKGQMRIIEKLKEEAAKEA